MLRWFESRVERTSLLASALAPRAEDCSVQVAETPHERSRAEQLHLQASLHAEPEAARRRLCRRRRGIFRPIWRMRPVRLTNRLLLRCA